MTYDPERHHRRSIRLKGYDYAQAGAYFITIVAQDRACLFGDVVDGEMRLNAAGQAVWYGWDAMPNRFPTVELDAFVVMPNHVHGIIVITNDVGAGHVGAGHVGAGLVPAQPADADDRATTRATTRVAPTDSDGGDSDRPTIGDVVGAFKSWTTVLYTRGVKQSAWPAFRGRLWQRNYYEHIIRDDAALRRIRDYIITNPARWALDEESPTKRRS